MQSTKSNATMQNYYSLKKTSSGAAILEPVAANQATKTMVAAN